MEQNIAKTDDEILKSILDKFQTERNRLAEESFARGFSENEEVRLFFINEDKAYTDGRNIVVDPAFFDIYKDDECIKNTQKILSWQELISDSPWNVLKMVTRGLTLHESLHLLYTNLPGNEFSDSDFFDSSTDDGKIITHKNELKTIANISNIIEDFYIEAVGASVYDNIGIYLMFNRVAPFFAKKNVESTASEKFKLIKPKEIEEFNLPEEKCENELTPEEKELLEKYLHFIELQKKTKILIEYLDYMAGILLYPMFEQKAPSKEIADYVEKTRQLFLDGSIQESPDERYKYCKEILKIIKPLIPQDEEVELGASLLPKNIAGQGSHEGFSNSIGGKSRKGKTQEVTTRLFTNLDGTKKSDLNPSAQELINAIKGFEKDEQNADEIINLKGYNHFINGASFAIPVHKDIKINEKHPTINLNLKKAYNNIYEHYKININSYSSKFLKILKTQVPVKETKYQFGIGIDSKKLGDVKKRFWYKNQLETSIPDLAILLLIDGSGSMDGSRRNAAMKTSIILHEVLKSQKIVHAIIEHRAHSGEPEIDVNVLVNFNSKDEEKYNIMQLDADENTRDGLALLWAERYLTQQTTSENKLILVISDGEPFHSYDDYTPPVSTKDTANIVKKIISRGTNVIAVALDDQTEYETYDALKEIYPSLIECNDLEKLTGQLLKIISRQLEI